MDESRSGLQRGLSYLQGLTALVGVLTVILGGFAALAVRFDRIEQRLIQMQEDPKRISALELDLARVQLRVEQLQREARKSR